MKTTAKMFTKDGAELASVTVSTFGLADSAKDAAMALIKAVEKKGGKYGDDWASATITIER